MENVIRFIGFITIGIGAFVVVVGLFTHTGFSLIPWAIASVIGGVFIMGFAKIISMVAEIRDAVVGQRQS